MKVWALAGTSAIAITASTVALWAFYGPSINGTTLLAGALGLTATCFAGAAYVRSNKAALSTEKMSSDLDILSRRLLRLESRFADIERLPSSKLRKSVAEVSGEIALLSGLLRDLASTVSGHDRDVATLAEAVHTLRERTAALHLESSEQARMQLAGSNSASPQEDSAPSDWSSLLTELPASSVVQPTLPVQPEPATTIRMEPAIHQARPAVEPALPPANDSADKHAVGSTLLARLQQLHEEREGAREVPEPDATADRRKRAILTAFREDRLEIHLQPIVSLPQRKTKFYEALARLRLDDDILLMPAEFMPTLEEAGLAPELDGKIAARAEAVARHLVNRGSEAFVTSNLSPAAMKTPGFLRALSRIMESYPDVLGRIAFEISQRSWRNLDAETAGALEQLRAKGAFFLLDRAMDLRIDPLTLADRGVRYVKLPAQMLIDPQPGNGLDYAVTDLSAVLARAGIKLIADKVETERIVPDLIDCEIPLAQGFVFGPPRAIRADIFGFGGKDGTTAQSQAPSKVGKSPNPASGSSPAKPAAKPPLPQAAAQRAQKAEDAADQPEGAEPRLPYRSFLRRAG